MSSPTLSRRSLHRLGLAGVGSAVLLVAIASPAVAATDVVIGVEPAEVALLAVPIENIADVDPMDPMGVGGTLTAPVPVQYGGSITVDLPDELNGSAVEAELVFDDNTDGTPEATYSSRFATGNPKLLVVATTQDSVTVTLPTDDPVAGDVAELSLAPVTPDAGLGEEFTFFDPVSYTLEFDTATPPTADPAVIVEPALIAYSGPCAGAIFFAERCAFPTPVTVGSTVTLDLTAESALRDLGLTDLTGVQTGLLQLDEDGFPTSTTPVVLDDVQVSGARASFLLPAGTAPGSYLLVVAQPTPSGGLSVFSVEITVVAEEVPAVVPPPAIETVAPAPQAVVVNAGLRSNTGVEAVDTGSTGSVAVAAGAGMLALAGAAGVAVARTRRRPSVEGGPCA